MGTGRALIGGHHSYFGLQVIGMGLIGEVNVRALILAFFICVASVGQAAAAEAPPKGYRQTVRNALIEVREKNWLEAKALFERAHAMYPNARTLRGLGIVAFSARDYLDAIGYLTAAIEHPVRPMTDKQRKGVEDMLGRSRAFIGYLKIDTNPTEADFLIDGETVSPEQESGKLPLNPGEHQLVVRADGRREATRTFKVEGGKTVTLTIQLEPLRQAVRKEVEREHAAEVAAARAAEEPQGTAGEGGELLRMPGLWTWVAAGGAVAFGAASGLAYWSAVGEARDLEGQCERERCDPARRSELISEASIGTKETVATVGLVLSVAAMAGAGVLYVLEGEGLESEAPLALTASPGHVGIRGHF